LNLKPLELKKNQSAFGQSAYENIYSANIFVLEKSAKHLRTEQKYGDALDDVAELLLFMKESAHLLV
jgi:hypothetical protein